MLLFACAAGGSGQQCSLRSSSRDQRNDRDGRRPHPGYPRPSRRHGGLPPIPSFEITRGNVERFWLGGAAHKWWRDRVAAGAAPVRQKRVGLKRLRRTPMGIVVAVPGSIGRTDCRFGGPGPALWEVRSGTLRLWLAIDRARDDVRRTCRPAREEHDLARHALAGAVVGVA